MLVSLAAFVPAAVLVVLLPGPDTLVVVRNLVRSGTAVAARAVAGVLCGLSVWVATAALGISAVLRASHDAYLALRIAGAVYLVYLGIRSLRSRGERAPIEQGGRLLGSGFTSGLLTDLLNPKVGVFFVTFLPGFVPHGDPVGWTSALFGGIFIVLTAGYFALMLRASGRITRWIGSPTIRRRLDRCTGLVLLGFGLRLAIE